MDLLAKAITWTSNVVGSEEGKCMKSSLPASPAYTQLPAAPLILPQEWSPMAWHPQGGMGQERRCPSTSQLNGLFCSQGSPTEPWIPLSSVLSLEHREWPLEMLLPGPFPSPSKVQPYCRFLPANPGAKFPQKQRKTLYLKQPHRYEFHLQMGESLPGYRKFWGQDCWILKFVVDQLQNLRVYFLLHYH